MSDPLGIMEGTAAAAVAQPITGAWLGHVAGARSPRAGKTAADRHE